MIILLFGLLSLLEISLAQSDNLTCSKNGTIFFYLNGINVFESGSIVSKDNLDTRFIKENSESLDSHAKAETDRLYNPTQGILADVAEVMSQKLEEKDVPKPARVLSNLSFRYLPIIREANLAFTSLMAPSVAEANIVLLNQFTETEEGTLEDAVTKVKTALLAGKKVVVVSHSQGNLFANQMYPMLEEDPDLFGKLQFYNNMQVATPAGAVFAPLAGGDYITNKDDLIITSIVSALPPNYDLVDFDITNLFDFTYPPVLGHGFDDVYLSNLKARKILPIIVFNNDKSMGDIFLEKLIQKAEALADNCDNFAIKANPEHAIKTQMGNTPLSIEFYIPSEVFEQRAIAMEDVTIEWTVSADRPFSVLAKNRILVTGIIPPFSPFDPDVYATIQANARIYITETGEVISNFISKQAIASCSGAGCCHEEDSRYVQTLNDGNRCISPPIARFTDCAPAFGYFSANRFSIEPYTVTFTDQFGTEFVHQPIEDVGGGSYGLITIPAEGVNSWSVQLKVEDFWGAQASAKCTYRVGELPVYEEIPYTSN